MRKLSLIVPLSTLIIMTVLLVIFALPTPKSKLEKAIAGADRIVVVWYKVHGTPTKKDVFTLTDKNQIARFLDCLEFDGTSNVESKVFLDAYHFKIFKGEELLADLLCDPTRMRWDGGEWEGCAVLAQGSREALLEWLKDNGWELPAD